MSSFPILPHRGFLQREDTQQHGLRLLLHGARVDAFHQYHWQMFFVLQGHGRSLKLGKYNRHAPHGVFNHLSSVKTEAVLVTAARFWDRSLFRFVVLLLDDIPEASLPSMATAPHTVPMAKEFYDVFFHLHFLCPRPSGVRSLGIAVRRFVRLCHMLPISAMLIPRAR